MYIARASWPSSNGKVYQTTYLRQSYRQGKQVKTRNIANLTHCPEEEIAAIELALKYKGNLTALDSLDNVSLQQGASVGAVWVLWRVAQGLGLLRALGTDFSAQLALWQVLARVIDQGSRLSAVRLAQTHAACDVLGIRRGFDENDLYQNLHWLSEHQPQIEQRLFAARRGDATLELFLYDVTSSYLEGDCNELGDYGYGRDGKKGKKQIVIGLLCDQDGEPVSTEVFQGNTNDLKTFSSQIDKAVKQFGCQRVTFVGDRGMIKSAQEKDLGEAGFHYITAITKPQIEKLLKGGVLQLELFEDEVCEVEEAGVRYVLRRNEQRVKQMAATRTDKQARVERLLTERNRYLAEHRRAKLEVAEKKVQAKIERLKIDGWLAVEADGRRLRLVVDEKKREEAARFDGCYVIKTDLPASAASSQVVHDRYKDLAQVEQAFRTSKTAHLEMRPIYVRKAVSTRGHVLVVMLAYLIRRELSRAWASLDLTVEEGLEMLKTICSMEVKVKGGGSCQRIPAPKAETARLLEALDIQLPEALPHHDVRVVTRKKLPERRKVTEK